MSDFQTAYQLTAINEGGYSNDPTDSGGETYAGISRKNFPHWTGWATVDKYKPMKQGQYIEDHGLKGLVMMFYEVNFWKPIKGYALESQELANYLYDTAVNMGVGVALQLLKQSL